MGTGLADETDWYSNDAATFGDRVAAAREAVGMNQEELARRIGVRPKTVRDWEDDLSEPRANKLQMLSGLLNVSLKWLLTGEGEGLTSPEAQAEGGPDIASILAEVRQLRTDLTRSADRLGRLEKQLRKRVGGAA